MEHQLFPIIYKIYMGPRNGSSKGEVYTGWQIQFFQHNLQWTMWFVFQTFFTEKNDEILKAFSPLFNFLLSFSPQTGKVVKMFWVFHLVSGWKLMENKWHFSLRIQQKILNFPTSVISQNPKITAFDLVFWIGVGRWLLKLLGKSNLTCQK
jgi:hypothetical protein